MGACCQSRQTHGRGRQSAAGADTAAAALSAGTPRGSERRHGAAAGSACQSAAGSTASQHQGRRHTPAGVLAAQGTYPVPGRDAPNSVAAWASSVQSSAGAGSVSKTCDGAGQGSRRDWRQEVRYVFLSGSSSRRADSDSEDAGCGSELVTSGSDGSSATLERGGDLSSDGADDDSGIQEDGGAAASSWQVRDAAGRHHTVLPMDPAELRGHCRALDSGAVRVGAGRFTLPRHALLSLPSYSAPRTIRPGEIVVCSVPKSGTTWTLEMAWLIANDCDFAGARTPLDQNRYTEVGNFFYLGLTPAFLRDYVPVVLTRLGKMAGLARLLYLLLRSLWRSAGLVKTHVPLSLLPPNLLETNKVIYVTRNPKDALVSYYHHFSRCRVVKYTGSLEDIAEDYMAGRLPGLPFFSHVLEAWQQRDHPNMLFLFYEDMKRDLPGTLRRVADFLGKTLTESQVAKLCQHLDFAHMKDNKHANSLMYQEAGILEMPSFIREGQVGGWRRHVSEETDQRLNEWIKDSVAGTGLTYQGVH